MQTADQRQVFDVLGEIDRLSADQFIQQV